MFKHVSEIARRDGFYMWLNIVLVSRIARNIAKIFLWHCFTKSSFLCQFETSFWWLDWLSYVFLQDLEKDASSTKPREALAVLRPNQGTLSSFAGSVKKGGLRCAFDLFCIFVVIQWRCNKPNEKKHCWMRCVFYYIYLKVTKFDLPLPYSAQLVTCSQVVVWCVNFNRSFVHRISANSFRG